MLKPKYIVIFCHRYIHTGKKRRQTKRSQRKGIEDIFGIIIHLITIIIKYNNYRHQGSIILMTVCPFVCLLAGMHKYYWVDVPEKKSEDGSLSNLDPIKF